MPIFEYKCNDCGKIVGKPANDTGCPGCDSLVAEGDPETRACRASGPCCCDRDS